MTRGGAAKAAHLCAVLALLPLAACNAMAAFTHAQPSAAASPAQDQGLAQTASLRTPAALRADPNRLIGLSRQEISGLLGEPGFVRRDRAAQMWRYIDDSCVLDLYLYAIAADSPDVTARVRHYDVRSRNARPVTPQACVSALLSHAPSTS